jgi:type II secretory pathway component GspD/PulD (secretin)
MKHPFLAQFACFLALTICTVQVHAEYQLRVFTLKHNLAQNLSPVLAQLLGEQCTVTGINNQLIIKAEEQQFAEIEALIDRLDIEKTNHRITLISNQHAISDESHVSVQGEINTGNVSIKNKPNHHNHVDIDFDHRNTQQQHHIGQIINVMDGAQAFITVGQQIPFSGYWASVSQAYSYQYNFTYWQTISTGFAVRPQTIGNQIELEITPRITNRTNNQFIDFSSYSTTIIVQPNTWVDIANVMQSHDAISANILSNNAQNNSQTTALKVKVE